MNALKVSLSFAVFGFLITWMGPTGCDETPVGPSFPGGGSSSGDDGREVIISLEDYDPRSPSWSPDCDKVVFARYDLRGGVSSKLYIYDIPSDTYTEVPNTEGNPAHPNWSSTGEWIAYFSGSTLHTYIIHPDGTGNTRVSTGIGGGAADWSPDGKELLLYGGKGLLIVDVSDPENLEYRDITPDEEDEFTGYQPGGWSPNGEYISYLKIKSLDNGMGWDYSYGLYLTDPYGKYYEVLVPDESDCGRVMLDGWSPDGRYLLIWYALGTVDLWAFDVKAGVFEQLTFTDPDDSMIDGFDWGNNGKIIFQALQYDMYHANPDGPWNIIYTIDGP
jgi:Tol biopolymer transport system component